MIPERSMVGGDTQLPQVSVLPPRGTCVLPQHTHHRHTNVQFFILKSGMYPDAHFTMSHGIILIILILFFLCLILNIFDSSSRLKTLSSAVSNVLLNMST